MKKAFVCGMLFLAAAVCGGCAEKKSRSVTIEGPEKKTELKIESTEKK